MTKRTRTRKLRGGMWGSQYGQSSMQYGSNPMQQQRQQSSWLPSWMSGQQQQQPPRYGYGGKGTKRRRTKRSRTMKRR